MSTQIPIVGEVVKISSSTFEWIVNDFFVLPVDKHTYYSPVFLFEALVYRFAVWHTNPGLFRDTLSLAVYIGKGSGHEHTCTLSIKNKNDKYYMNTTLTEPELFNNKFCFIWDVCMNVCDQKNIAPDGIMIISCTFNCKPGNAKEEKTATVRNINVCAKEKEESKEVTASDRNDALLNPCGVDRLSHNLKQLLISEELSDVTLKVQGREFRAHKLILGSQSPVFHSMFKHDTVERSSGFVDIPDCDPDSFKTFLHYLYSGRSEEMSTSNVLSLYFIADKYHAEDLKAECVTFMMRELSVDTFCDFIALALLYNESKLLEDCTAFFGKHTKIIIVTADWQSFVKENPIAANELFIKAFDKCTNQLK